ncbi:MAG: CBS domain-containing protein [Bacteriovoracaceae bacterium]|nr:CBS domain-containing protein [Bacteriovoracaceae bacterium]
MSDKPEVKDDFADKTIDELMITDVLTLSPNLTIRQCIELILKKGVGGAPIVKENTKKVLSIIGQKDLIQFAAVGGLDKPLMTFIGKLTKFEDLIVASKIDTLKRIIIKFLQNPVRRILVVDEQGNLEGILTRSQLLKAFIEAK